MPSRARKMIHLAKRGRFTASLSSSGFTLLEAIVAIAIVGIALVPVMTFISQMAFGLTRAADSNARNLAQQSLIELFETLNPLERPVGEDQVGDLIIRWESESLVPPNPQVNPGAGLAGFSIGFYNVTVSVDRINKGPWFSFAMRKVGYRSLSTSTLPGFKP
jgi:prepilin-type N-terminal cleavage/methylation domain-containing protein